jgi:hypothetical protein
MSALRGAFERSQGTTMVAVTLFVLLLVGWANLRFLTPFSAPLLVGDARGGFAFYRSTAIEGDQEPRFVLRRTEDGRAWSEPRRAEGRLLSASLGATELSLLFPGFLSRYERGGLTRRVSVSVDRLGFSATQLALHRGRELLLGLDDQGALCVAEVHSESVTRLEPRLAGMGLVGAGEADRESGSLGSGEVSRAAPRARPGLVAWSTHEHEGALVVLALVGRRAPELGSTPLENRAARGDAQRFRPLGSGPFEARWTRLVDGRFEPFRVASEPWFSAGLFRQGEALKVAAVTDPETRSVELRRFDGEGFLLERGLPVPPRIGLLGSARVASVACAAEPRALVLAQVGGSVRCLGLDEMGAEWLSLARLPSRQRSLIYLWCGLVLASITSLVTLSFRAYWQRPRRALDRARELDAEALLRSALDGDVAVPLASEDGAAEDPRPEPTPADDAEGPTP